MQRRSGAWPYCHRTSAAVRHRAITTIVSDYVYEDFAQDSIGNAQWADQSNLNPCAYHGSGAHRYADVDLAGIGSGMNGALPQSTERDLSEATLSLAQTSNQQLSAPYAAHPQAGHAALQHHCYHDNVHQMRERQLIEAYDNAHDAHARSALVEHYCMINEAYASGQHCVRTFPGCACLWDNNLCRLQQRYECRDRYGACNAAAAPRHPSKVLPSSFALGQPSFTPYDERRFAIDDRYRTSSDQIMRHNGCSSEEAYGTSSELQCSDPRNWQSPIERSNSTVQPGYQRWGQSVLQDPALTALDPYYAAAVLMTQTHGVRPASNTNDPSVSHQAAMSPHVWSRHCKCTDQANTRNDSQGESLTKNSDTSLQTRCPMSGREQAHTNMNTCGLTSYKCSTCKSCMPANSFYDNSKAWQDIATATQTALYARQDIKAREAYSSSDATGQHDYFQATQDSRVEARVTTTTNDAEGDLESGTDVSDSDAGSYDNDEGYFSGEGESYVSEETEVGRTSL